MIRIPILLIFFLLAGLAQPTPETPRPEERWAVRLSTLAPSNPRAYFELAEEVLDEGDSLADQRLAQMLFVLAYELDRRSNAPSNLRASCCIALASIPVLERDRGWLLALAGMIDPRTVRAGPGRPVESLPAATAYEVATLLGHVRAGEGVQARALLSKEHVRRALQDYERLLSPVGAEGGASVIENEAIRWPCTDCNSQRFVRRPGSSPPEYRVCPACRGLPGPALKLEDLIAQLRLESRLLSGVHTSWSAQLAADDEAPLRDPEPDELARTYQIDAGKPYFRRGAWSATR